MRLTNLLSCTIAVVWKKGSGVFKESERDDGLNNLISSMWKLIFSSAEFAKFWKLSTGIFWMKCYVFSIACFQLRPLKKNRNPRGRGFLELWNPGRRGVLAVWEIHSEGGVKIIVIRAGGIFPTIIQYCINFNFQLAEKSVNRTIFLLIAHGCVNWLIVLSLRDSLTFLCSDLGSGLFGLADGLFSAARDKIIYCYNLSL